MASKPRLHLIMPPLGNGLFRLADGCGGRDAARGGSRVDVQALRRRGARNWLLADVLHALLLLKRLRRLAVPRKVEAAMGYAGRRLFRAISVGPGRLRLAADHAGYADQLPGLHRADDQRHRLVL